MYQTVWTQIRPDKMSGLNWVQTVCKGFQQRTLAGNKTLKPVKHEHLLRPSLTLCLLGNIACFFLSAEFFQKTTFSKNSLRNIIRVSNSLDPDQAGHSVGPDLDVNCF